MKILFIINSLQGGGAERVVQTLSEFFISHHNDQVVIATLSKDGNVYQIDKEVKLIPLVSQFKLEGPFKIIGLALQAYELYKLIKKENPDVVLSFLVRSNLVHILTRFFGNKRSIFISERNTSTNQYRTFSIKNKIMIYLLKWLYPKADGIIAISKGVKDSLTSLGVDTNKIGVIYNPQPIQKIKQIKAMDRGSKKSHRIVTVGRLIQQKDHVTLIKAVSKVKEALDIELIIIGIGPLEIELKNLVHMLDLNDTIHFMGWIEEPVEILKSSDLFVLSSKFEGFGNVIIEAMAAGLPVICTDCESGPREILQDGKSGILVPVGDVDEMCNAIIKLLKQESTYEYYKRKSIERAEDFDVTKIAPSYIQFLNNARLNETSNP